MTQIINGVEYKSLKEAAEEHKISRRTLSKRLAKYGRNDPRLFKPTVHSEPFVINGKKFATIQAAAIELDISEDALYKRIKNYGKNSKEAHVSGSLTAYRNHVTLAEKEYDSIAQAARVHGMKPITLYNRIRLLGKDSSRLFDKRDLRFSGTPSKKQAAHKRSVPIVLNGQHYASIAQAAREHQIETSRLRHRIAHYGNNDPRLFAQCDLRIKHNDIIALKSIKKKKKGGEKE